MARLARRTRTGLVAAAALLALAAGACSAGGSGDAESSASVEDVALREEGGTGGSGDSGGAAAPESGVGRVEKGLTGSGAAGDGPNRANRSTVQTRAVIRTGEVSLVAKEMSRARLEIDGLVAEHGGYLASEDTTNDRRGRPQRSVLVLRVPEPAFADVMAGLTGIGRTLRADRSSDDVTTEVIDVDTRVATAEASLARLQRFLRQATTVDDMIRLESEIATRQAELESLKAPQKYLSDQTSMSTITVRLRTPDAPPPAPDEDDQGFLAGLAGGWDALQTVLVGTATVVGALLPFAVTFAVVGAPVWLLVRTLRRRRITAPTPPAAEAG